MDSPNSRSGRPRSADAENGRCNPAMTPNLLPTSPNQNAPPQSRSPLSTVAVQAVFHKSRSHTDKSSPRPPAERKQSFGSNSSFPANSAYTVCIPIQQPQAADNAIASSFALQERQQPRPRTVANRSPQSQRDESEDNSCENPRTVRENELGARSMLAGPNRPSAEAATFVSSWNIGRELEVPGQGVNDQNTRLGPSAPRGRGNSTQELTSSRYERTASETSPGSMLAGTSGIVQEMQAASLYQQGRTSAPKEASSGGGIPQAPPPPPPGRHVNSQVLKDPACDPDNPYILQFQDVTAAAFMIRNAITITPCVHSRVSRMTGMDVFLKKDFMQLTGSFKERGARYALLMLTPEQRAIGIVAASLGNHALALACHGAQLGVPVTVVMPTRAPLAKVSACRAYGANVIIEGEDLAESRRIALELTQKGLTYINGYDHPHILAGQGTLGLELLEQVCDIDAIVIPVGGGGLLAGVARAAKTLYPNIKIIAVESENCASFSAAQAAGKPVLIESQPTIADGLAVPMVGVNAFASAAPLVDRMIVVNEDLIALSILRIVEIEKNVVEGAGAAGIAAMLSGQMDDFKNKRVVILACGGNIDVSMLGRCLERGLCVDGRLLSFTVFVDQNPTSLSELFALIGRVGATIKDMTHDRKWESEYFFYFPVKIVVETPGATTSRELRTVLSQMYKKIIFHHNFEPIVSHQPMYPVFPNVECGGNEKTSKRGISIPVTQGSPESLMKGSVKSPIKGLPESLMKRPAELLMKGPNESLIKEPAEPTFKWFPESTMKGPETYQEPVPTIRCVPKESLSSSPTSSGTPKCEP